MAQTKVEGGVCRIRMALPSNQSEVTIGSGCLVRSSSFLSCFPPTENPTVLSNDVFIITSRQVLAAAKGGLNSNTSLTAEFLDRKSGKLSSFPLDVVHSRDLPERILNLSHSQMTHPGHSYGQFTVIPVENLDRRNKLQKMISKFSLTRADRPLKCFRGNEDKLKSLLDNRQLFCYVLFDCGSTFNTEAYYLTLDDGEFALTPVSGRSECFKKESDFSREGKPCGSVILNSAGECVGVLTLTVDDRKVLPVFLRIQENENAAKSDKITNADCYVLQKRPHGSKERHLSEGDKIVLDKSKATSCTTMDSNMAPPRDGTNIPQRHEDKPEVAQSSSDTVPLVLDVESEHHVSLSSAEPDNSFAGTGDLQHNSCEGPYSADSSLVSNIDGRIHDSLGSHSLPSHHDQKVQEDPDLKDDVRFPIPASSGPETLKQLEPTEEGSCSGKGMFYQRSQSEIPSRNNGGASGRSGMFSRSLTYPCAPASGSLKHVHPDSLLSEKIVSKIHIMDKLAQYLNTVVRPKGVDVIQNWLHLAELYKVPKDVKDQCQHSENLSPSSDLFEYLCIANPSISILRKHLEEMYRTDVVDELPKAVLHDSATINDLCDAHPQALGCLCLKLDHGRRNWRELGQRLGLGADKLRQFGKSTEVKPAEAILRKIQTKFPRKPIKEIKDVLRDMDRGDVCEALDGLEDDATMTTLYNNFEIWEKVTQLLQMETKAANNWEMFAYKHGIPKEVCDSLKPSFHVNPTKSILEFIVQRDPYATVEHFLKTLMTMEREDVVEGVLKKFFYADDIDIILRQLTADRMPTRTGEVERH